MDHMTDHMMQGMQYRMTYMWIVVAIFGMIVIVIFVFFARRAPTDNLLIANLAAEGNHPSVWLSKTISSRADTDNALAHDTIFILPDISHYTRFMTGNQFAFAHAQHIIFSLINAMIEAATKTVELSKLEGDAALFYVDAGRYSDDVIGQTVMEIFRAFFKERKDLKESNICPCRACRHIDDLDLKIFVHRGKAARFKFRGSIDHFGTDVIVLHRIMKNGVRGHRYIMVTDAAVGCISLPIEFESFQVEEDVEHFGSVRASVFEVDDAMATELSDSPAAQRPSLVKQTFGKLRENIRSIQAALGRFRQQT